jgi:hypothetical protein
LASDAKVSIIEAASFYPNELFHLDWWLNGGLILSKEHRALFNAETREVGLRTLTVWYPQYDGATLDRVITPSFVVLGHELFHVRQLLRPSSEKEYLFKNNPISGIRNIEVEAVEFENRLRQSAELPLRRYYGGVSLEGGASIWPWESFSPDPNPPENTDSQPIYDPFKPLPLP